jgi:DNA polymerase III delta subunit
MKSIVVISGPRDSGPGEREQALDRAAKVFTQLGVDDPTRIDVPGKGAGSVDSDGTGQLRNAVQHAVPALQSGSLFAGKSGLLVVDAQNLLKAECEVLAELVEASDHESVVAVFVALGAVPAPLGKALRTHGESISVKKLRERDATDWLTGAARERGLRLDRDAVEAFVAVFGSDVAAMRQALDQLAVDGGEISGKRVRDRFKNRPDEPIWHFTDAIAKGDSGEALRRLEDFLLHGHPLQLLASLESDLRKRALAQVAPDRETFADWIGQKASAYPVKKVWDSRGRVRASDLHRALTALSKADLHMKTAPETTHRVTLERLTVAMCRWYGPNR